MLGLGKGKREITKGNRGTGVTSFQRPDHHPIHSTIWLFFLQTSHSPSLSTWCSVPVVQEMRGYGRKK